MILLVSNCTAFVSTRPCLSAPFAVDRVREASEFTNSWDRHLHDTFTTPSCGRCSACYATNDETHTCLTDT